MVEEQDIGGASRDNTIVYHTNGDDMLHQQDEEASFKAKVEGLLLCPVCHETVADPRQLNCGHFFCSECVDLLTVDELARCARCQQPTPVSENGVRKDELAVRLLELLAEYTRPSKREVDEDDDRLPAAPFVNGSHIEEEDEDDASLPELNGVDNVDAILPPDVSENGAADGTDIPAVDDTTNGPAVDDPTDVHDASSEEDNVTEHANELVNLNETPGAQVTLEETLVVEDRPAPAAEDNEEAAEADEQADGSLPPPEFDDSTDDNESRDAEPIEDHDDTLEIAATPETQSEPEEDQQPAGPTNNAETEPDVVKKMDEPEITRLPEEPEQPTQQSEEIIEPPADYQSPGEEEHDDPPSPQHVTEAEVHVPTIREPVEHSHETLKVERPPPESQMAEDEPDRKMKASEIKPSDVAITIEMERQCGDCNNKDCTCNCNNTGTLLTPPVSMGSQLSVETTTSNNPSDDGEDDVQILVRLKSRFTIKESASHIEVANKNKIYVTRWTYDDDGQIGTYDNKGNKVKFLKSSSHNYSGVTLSKLGFIFALNTSKNRVEEYSAFDGKKVKQFKLDHCRDPQAVDIMGSSGEILVVDQDGNSIIVYPNNKKSNKPRAIRHELLREPADIATTTDAFYVTCTAKQCLLKMDLSGNVIWSYGLAEDQRKLKVPKGVCVDENGLVYVVDQGASAIFVFSKDGTLKGRIHEKERGHMRSPWYVSVRDGLMAVLCSHNVVKTYEFA